MSGEVQVKFKLLLLRLSKGLCMGPGKVRLSMVRWSSEAQVTVRLGSNLKSILGLTLVDLKLVTT